jgi:hypothetical protein
MATKAALLTEVSSNFPDNTTGLITPAVTRTTHTDEINSWQQAPAINVQTGTTYTILTNDYGQMVTFNNPGAVAVSLPAASGAGFFPFNTLLKNIGAGVVTVTPTTSTIDGAASLTLTVGQSAMVISDGTNYRTAFLAVASGGGGSGTVVAGTINQLAYYAAAGTTVSGETLLQAVNHPALTGDVTCTAGTVATTIAAAAVTNAKMANMVTATIKGNNSGSTGAPLDLTTTQVTAMLNPVTTALQGVAPASGGGTTNFLRADGTWAAPAGGGGGVNAGTINQLAYYATAGSTVSGETLLQAVNMPALTGDVITPGGSLSAAIAAGAVTNVKLANMPIGTIKGNNTAATATPIDLLPAQVTALLNLFTTALQGLVPASGGGTANFLRADGTWNTPGIPINNQSVAYTAVLADANTAITHPVTDNTARTFTIPANASVAYPVGTTLTFVNMINTLTIAITTDTMTLSSAGTTGSRTLAANGIATALKLTSTTWLISGTGLT